MAEYERLRAFALGTAHAPGFGWAVFLRQGMRAWGETCRPLAPSPQSVSAPATGTASGPAGGEVVQVLASMVLAVHQGRMS